MPHHYHLKTQSAIFWVTFLGIALLAQQPASAQQLRRIYYGTSASVCHLPVWVAKDAGLFAKNGLNVELGPVARIKHQTPGRALR